MENKFLELLEKESEHWVREGIITPEQKQKILRSYTQEPPAIESSLKENVNRWILILASFLVGLGIFSLIAANWQYLSFFIKLIIILICMVGSYTGGYILKEHRKAIKSGTALIYLGCSIYGAGIFLIGQHHHTPTYNWTSGFVLWLLGATALAHTTGIFSLFYLVILLSVISIIGFPFIIFNTNIISSFFLLPFWLSLVTSIILFFMGYHLYKRYNTNSHSKLCKYSLNHVIGRERRGCHVIKSIPRNDKGRRIAEPAPSVIPRNDKRGGSLPRNDTLEARLPSPRWSLNIYHYSNM